MHQIPAWRWTEKWWDVAGSTCHHCAHHTRHAHKLSSLRKTGSLCESVTPPRHTMITTTSGGCYTGVLTSFFIVCQHIGRYFRVLPGHSILNFMARLGQLNAMNARRRLAPQAKRQSTAVDGPTSHASGKFLQPGERRKVVGAAGTTIAG